MEFTFGIDIIDRVVREIKEAKKYVRIAVFQIHNESIYDALDHVLRKDVVVEVFTLPYDSINEDIRDKVKNRIERIKTNGAKVYFSKWGIGDPERTTTAVGRWYSFHGKFLVTDNVAISISANLTEESELDAMLIYREQEKIREFNEKFLTLLTLFEKGSIKNLVEQTEYDNKETLFLAPRTITEPEVRSHWIRDYPSEMCKTIISIENGLYIAPIECRARDLWEMVINEATEYIYISTESFTDTAIIPFLITNSIEGKIVKILTGSESQDFNERIRELYPRLMANNIELRKPNHPLHAKLIITDKRLIVSSVNFNKMNLGYAKKKALWRANTETITVESNPDTIRKAKADYDEIFNASIQLLNYLSEKEGDYAVSIFTVYGVKPDKNVKNLLSRVIVRSDIKLKRNLYQIGRYASILIKKFNKSKPIIETPDFLCAMVLYYLSDRKHTESELKEKLSEIFSIIDNESIIEKLLQYKLIIKEEEFYKIDLKTLLGEA
jgi:phosphatidylserine/phosphatidylglycerophosphate/cardiolipin synthase-like enzyme